MYLLDGNRAFVAQKVDELSQRGDITILDSLPPRTMTQELNRVLG